MKQPTWWIVEPPASAPFAVFEHKTTAARYAEHVGVVRRADRRRLADCRLIAAARRKMEDKPND